MLNSEQLQKIRDDDVAAGGDLQLCPRAWQQRRDLLQHITDVETEQAALVKELNIMVLGDGPQVFMTLAGVVGEMRRMIAMQRAHADAMHIGQPPPPNSETGAPL